MIYKTQTHQAPPRHIKHDGMLTPTAPLIRADDRDTLATLGIYPHITLPGDAPLGYTAWQVTGDGHYAREPAGSEAEREAARLRQRRKRQSLTRLQARLYLLSMPDATHGTAWDAVQAWAVSQGGAVQAYFEDAQHWQRLDAHVLAGAEQFGWDAQHLDEMFTAAAAGASFDAPDAINININTASRAELESLPGVGAALAQEIIAGRPWTGTSQLTSIPGISETMVLSWSVTV